MIVLHASITVVAGRETEFEVLAQELTAATLQNESGVTRYEYIRLGEPGHYLATLAFVDYDAFIVHQASEHHVVITGEMRDLIAHMTLDRVGPVPGCSALGPPLDGVVVRPLREPDPATMHERTDTYRARYLLAPSDWWSTVLQTGY